MGDRPSTDKNDGNHKYQLVQYQYLLHDTTLLSSKVSMSVPANSTWYRMKSIEYVPNCLFIPTSRLVPIPL